MFIRFILLIKEFAINTLHDVRKDVERDPQKVTEYKEVAYVLKDLEAKVKVQDRYNFVLINDVVFVFVNVAQIFE